jgi:LysM repeat protein
MTERGLPNVEGAPACPFVAFDDDRDGRSLAPDHRHRCFAEPRPATRALAHQEAYCLSSAFPVCPTFQDWARREAAIARGGAAQAASSAGRTGEPPMSTPVAPAAVAARQAAGQAPGEAPDQGPDQELDLGPDQEPDVLPPDWDASPAGSVSATAIPPSGPEAPRRSTQRDWAAPPPWLAETDDGALDDGPLYSGDPYDDLPPLHDARYAAVDDPDTAAGPASAEPPSFLAAKSATPADPSLGLAGSAADRFAGGDPYAPQPAPPQQPARPAAPDPDLEDWAGPGTAAVAAATARPSSSSGGRRRYEAQRVGPGRDPQGSPRTPVPPAGSQDKAGRAAGGRGGRGKELDAQELFGPAWEPARRFEAYPSLRTRIGLPRIGGIPPLGLAVIALVLAAAFLFFVGPMLLGIGSDGDNAAASPTPAATEEITAEPAPTLPPEPTPQVYTVRPNDTISKIAKKFGVTAEELLAANPQIKNPDRIKVGQEITIPVPAAEEVVDDTVEDGTVEDSPVP